MPRSIPPASVAVVFFGCIVALFALTLSFTHAENPVKDGPKVEPLTLKGYKETIGMDTKIEFEMIPIPGGTYMMGSPDTEKGRKEDEGPQHPVHVKPFWMGQCEVTWEEYDLYWKGEATTKPTPPYADETFGYGRDGRPVICITHHAAMEYCRWLSAQTKKEYRLPTEAEWEWACRAGTTTPYSFGDDAAKLPDYAWFVDNSEESPQPVGKKKPNPWGLHDMHGNTAEWCLDHYVPSYKEFPTDKVTFLPVLLPTNTRFSHVARGGSWMDKPELLRSAARRGSDKKWIKLDPQRPQSIWWLTSAEFVGFRVVRAENEQDNLKGLKSKVTRESN